MNRILLYVLLCGFFCPILTYAQVTTGSVTGTIKTIEEKRNEIGLEGATITLIHEPSGTKYVTLSRKGGSFAIAGVRVGGPYRLTVNHVGYQPQRREGFDVSLGDSYDFTILMTDRDARELEGVVVSTRKKQAAVEKSGAATVINSRMLATLPSFNRSITDFTRLTPQAGANNSFAGRSGYYNNLKVDGANLNNNFGLNTDPVPGGAPPISLDAFDEISVNIAPVDVRQSGFTGAGINAVTKSGTNEFHGTLFGFYRDQTFNGLRAGDVDLERADAAYRRNIGFSLGGPIIKNKLFFFINGEFEDNSGNPITNLTPRKNTTGQLGPNESAVPLDSMAMAAKYLKDTYNYNVGAYTDYPVAKRNNYKYLAKLDWNIDAHHKVTAKFSDFVSTEDPSSINASGPVGNGTYQIPGAGGTTSSLPNSRMSNRAMTFSNSVYGFEHTVRSGTLELNSNYRNFSNNLLFTISKIRDTRITNSEPFPFVDIFNGSTTPSNQMSFGYEPYSFNNDVVNNIWNITNNFTYYAGKHTFTGGFSYERQMVGNMFMPGAQSYYIFNSLNDFMTKQAPLYYAYTYSMIPDEKAVYSAQMKYGLMSFYAQDEIRVSPKLKVTVGLRADRPVYLEKALENPAITAMTLPDKNGRMTHYNGQWPAARVALSPRIGARWDVKGDKSLIIRGSTGIFNGANPFVWLTNMPTNSGMYQNTVVLRNINPDEAAILAGMTFDPKLDAYAKNFTPIAGASIPSTVVQIDKNFKMPQVFRTDVAVDKDLGNGFSVSLEGIITKDINAIFMRNANLKDPTGLAIGPDNRPRYMSTAAVDRSIYSNVSSIIIMENTNKGFSTALSAMISKNFSKGFYGSLAYTYTRSKDVSALTGAQGSSIWSGNATVGTSNDQELYPSSYANVHRVVSTLSYRLEYTNHAATTLSLVYQGYPSGNISYRYNGDMNGDGNNQDLMFIPNKATDLKFEQYTETLNGVTYTFTPQQQAAALDEFINNTPYLKKNRGKYAERNGSVMPWFSNLSARITQEFYIKAGKRKHTLQVTSDINNLPNLLNRYWGINKNTTTTTPLSFRSYNADGEPVYRMQHQNGVLFSKPYQESLTSGSTWSMQLGVRYIF